ncbi:MBL fold metallo-hydrolase [Xinfangfangia sp. CPCC 101601]|uniref:MBL fold metallo-hydrolase n=1 Tax=Pseudogemmobacter lacusdianii TaxID=3069608 RepID=A0ABU0VX80_9RHOB|nr:MBL fold metallo-hydrolase [Xinfangfangia sp. CPCC 101601]MDQ2066314.1 MBL fold metallo-hydrolase [Xinfangfangia sp. CPCC 101601]
MSDALQFPFPEPPAPGQAAEVAPGVLWLRLPLPMALDHVNIYALEDGPGWTLIDTGMRSRRGEALWQEILQGPLAGRPVTKVILTHHHPDHVGMVGWFQERGAELYATRTAWLYARMLTLDVQEQPSPQAMAFWAKAGLSAERLAARQAERPFNFADVVHPLPQGFTRISEGDVLRIGARDWTVRLGSGHAPDHATLWTDGLVLGGDQLLPGISANIGVYPTEPEADPLAEWLQSCAAFEPYAKDSDLILPGHKLPFTGLPFRLRQMIDNHLSALERLLQHLETPKTAVECFPVLFKRPIGPAEEGLALVEAVAHLNWLLHRGKVSRSLGKSGAYHWERL